MKRHCTNERLAVYRGLPPAERLSVDAHLRQCPACTARLAGYERVDQSLHALPDIHLPARLQQPWSRQMAVDHPATPDRRRRNGPGYAVGRVLLPASLVIGLIVGVWLLLASLTGDDNRVAATPTLTLTPTATTAALLHEGASAVSLTGFAPPPLPQAAAVLPPPRPTLIAVYVHPAAALRTP